MNNLQRIISIALLWHENGREDYLWWQTQDKKMIRRINHLIRDMKRSPFDGIGKPKPLEDNMNGWWIRRIDMVWGEGAEA